MRLQTFTPQLVGILASVLVIFSSSRSHGATVAFVTGGGNNNNSSTASQNGTVTFAGLTIANWSITGAVTGFGTGQDIRITTTTGNTIGVDIRQQGAGNANDDVLDFTLTVTPIAGTPYDITGIRVLGRNPDNARNYGPPSATDLADVLTFTGTNLGNGTLSDPANPAPGFPNGNLDLADGATISVAGGTASWLPGDVTDWTQAATEWTATFPEITPGLDTTPVSLRFQADFMDHVFSEGFSFQILVPEPSRAVLLALGLSLVALRRKR